MGIPKPDTALHKCQTREGSCHWTWLTTCLITELGMQLTLLLLNSIPIDIQQDPECFFQSRFPPAGFPPTPAVAWGYSSPGIGLRTCLWWSCQCISPPWPGPSEQKSCPTVCWPFLPIWYHKQTCLGIIPAIQDINTDIEQYWLGLVVMPEGWHLLLTTK